MNQKDDVLGSFHLEDSPHNSLHDNITLNNESVSHETTILHIQEDKGPNQNTQNETLSIQETLVKTKLGEEKVYIENSLKTFGKKILKIFIFITKYFTTSVCIFGVLMVASNYSAYIAIAQSIIYAEEMQHTKQSLIESVAASEITESASNIISNTETFRQLNKEKDAETQNIKSIHDIGELALESNQNIDLGIEITPYENRIVIPKIGKNIPLLDIKQTKVQGVDELNEIFMKDLEKGVIRYPGSAKPGEKGNSFIFGHSSNFPWMQGDYNDVFALLDNVVFDDEVIVYYGQEKHTYKIKSKEVIRPGDVSVLRSHTDDDRSQITLMTCWPIGTTLNRLVLIGELVKVEK